MTWDYVAFKPLPRKVCVERCHCCFDSGLRLHFRCNDACRQHNICLEAELDCLCKVLGVEGFVRDGLWPRTSGSHHISPERLAIVYVNLQLLCCIGLAKESGVNLLAKKGNDGRWSSIKKATSCCSCTAMVNHSGHMSEQPLVRTIVQIHDVISLGTSELTPPS